jgi:hypothetical protein
MLKTFALKVYNHYVSCITALCRHDSSLEEGRPFPTCSVYPSVTFNFGPSQSIQHLDPKNWVPGMCDLTNVGDFDPTLGGHLILWDLGIMIQFPPGSHILIPSAFLYHSTATIQNGEMRHSFTQYFAGALVRWVDNGFKLVENLNNKEMEEYERIKEDRDEIGLAFFSRLGDLQDFK